MPSPTPSIPSITYRASRMEDLEAVTRIHMEGFIGYRSSLLGKTVVRRLNRWFILHPDAVSFTAVSGGEVCGYVVGAPAGFTRPLTRYALGHLIAAVLFRPVLWIEPSIWKGAVVKMLQLLGVRFGPRGTSGGGRDQRHFELVGIGVDARHRSQGIAGALMRAFEEEVARRGFSRVTASVKPANRAAQRTFEKSGWRIVHEDSFTDLLVYEKLRR